eukprot:COSAG02_NODE_25872_length_646_cov_2.742230_2_plen_44_part_00
MVTFLQGTSIVWDKILGRRVGIEALNSNGSNVSHPEAPKAQSI